MLNTLLKDHSFPSAPEWAWKGNPDVSCHVTTWALTATIFESICVIISMFAEMMSATAPSWTKIVRILFLYICGDAPRDLSRRTNPTFYLRWHTRFNTRCFDTAGSAPIDNELYSLKQFEHYLDLCSRLTWLQIMHLVKTKESGSTSKRIRSDFKIQLLQVSQMREGPSVWW